MIGSGYEVGMTQAELIKPKLRNLILQSLVFLVKDHCEEWFAF